MSYASDTSVSVERSRAHIEQLLLAKGAGQIMSAFDVLKGTAIIGWSMGGRMVRMSIPLPNRNDEAFTMEAEQLEPRRLTLENLAGGVMEELFQTAIDRVIASIDDQNTDPEKKRVITFTVAVVGDAKREALTIGVQCDVKLPKSYPAKAQARMGMHKGQLICVPAFEQGELFNDPVGRPRPI